MPARVTSVEALDAFKASLTVYLSKAGRVMDDIRETVVRTRVWLETDRLPHWKKMAHQRRKELARAEQELFTVRSGGLPEAVKSQRLIVDRARIALEAAEEKLARVKYWIGHYEVESELRMRVIHQFRQLLSYDMRQALAFLHGVTDALAAYSESTPPAPVTGSAGSRQDAQETGALIESPRGSSKGGDTP